MKIENVDEAEELIGKLRIVQRAKKAILYMRGEDGGDPDTFALVEKDTQIAIDLPSLKAEVLESISAVLQDQHEKIVARMQEI